MVHGQIGESCLHGGCKYGHTAVLQYLTSIHTNIDLQDNVSIALISFLFVPFSLPFWKELLKSNLDASNKNINVHNGEKNVFKFVSLGVLKHDFDYT